MAENDTDRAGRRTAAKQSAAPLPQPKEAPPMMTPTGHGGDPYPVLLAALTYHERHVLYAALSSGWAKQAVIYRHGSPIYQDTYELLGDINEAPARAAAYLEAATATCCTCGASGGAVELEKITALPVGGGRTRTEWLCADRLACNARLFPGLADANREGRAA